MEALHAWHEFYLLLGTAAATVLALPISPAFFSSPQSA
jgi:hypothetical protein